MPSRSRWHSARNDGLKPPPYRHTTERGIIGDSVTHIIASTGTYSRSKGGFQNGAATGAATVQTATRVPGTADGYIDVDAQRHMKPGRSVNELRNGSGTNLLFCDGSVRPVTPLVAWCALRNNGLGSSTP